MTRTFSALVILAALAGPAAAQEARVNVVGMSEAAARQEIRQAVQTVCQAADRQGAFDGVYTVQNCLMDGEARGMAQYRDYQRAAAAQSQAQVPALASNDDTTPRR
jgi:hypothetical protein